MRKGFSVKLRLLVLGMLITSMFALNAYAGTVYFSSTTLASGHVSHSYPSGNTNGWRVVSGTTVKLSYTLGAATSNVHFGLLNSSTNGYTKFGTFSGTKTLTKSKSIGTTAYYKASITNNSASSISIKNTSYISY